MDATLMETLQSRLNLKQVERDQKKEFARNVDMQISRMLRSAPKRPQHSVDVLKQMISELETIRSTTSMTLSSEKNVIREIRELKGQIRRHKEQDSFQDQISDMKKMKQKTLEYIVEIGKQISELEGALGRLEIRGKLFMMGVDVPIQFIVERDVTIRKEDVAFVVNALEDMEKRYSASIELDRQACRVRVAGTKEAVSLASEEIEKIASATIRRHSLANVKARVLSLNRHAFTEFAKQHDVMADIGSRHVMLRGPSDSVELVLKHIETLTSFVLTIELPKRNLVGIVIGKNGSTISDMEKRHHVVCNVTDSVAASLSIMGPKDQAEECAEEFRDLIRENTYIESRFDEIKLDSVLAREVRSSNMFRNAARQNKCYYTLKYDDVTDEPYVMIGGVPKAVKAGKEALQDTIEAWKKLNVKISLPTGCFSIVSGKSQFMTDLSDLAKPCNLNALYDTKEILLHGKEESQVQDALRKIKEKVEDLRFVRIKLSKSMAGCVIGRKGVKIKEITKKSEGARLTLNDNDEVEILGPSKSVEIAKGLVEEVVDSNFFDTINVPNHGFIGRFIGKKGETMREFGKKFEVEVSIPKTRKTAYTDVMIRGKKDQVKLAMNDIKSQIEKYRREHRQIGVHKLCLPNLVGQKGEKIKKIQEEFGVRVNLEFQTGLVSIRGPEDKLDSAEAKIIEIAGKCVTWKPYKNEEPCAECVVLVKQSCIRHVVGTAGSVAKRIESDFEVHLHRDRRNKRKSSSNVDEGEEKFTILGRTENVNRAKEAIESILDEAETFKKTITVKKTPFVAVFGENYSGLKNLQDISSSLNMNVKPSSGKSNSLDVFVSGTRKGFQVACDAIEASNRRKATTFLRLIREHIPSVKSSERNLSKISSETKCKITLDDRTCCVVIVGPPQTTSKAASQIHTMLEFLFEGHYGRVVIPESYIPKLLANKAAMLREFEQSHADCNPTFKRSDRIVCFCSKDKSAVSRAHDTLNKMLLLHEKTNVRIEIPDPDYIGDIIGAKGSKITQIKKELGLNRITLRQEDNTLILSTKDQDTAENAKKFFQDMFDQMKKERCVFRVDANVIPVIIGKKGATIQELTQKTKCRIDVKKSGEVRLRGTESSVNAARDEIERLVQQQEKRQGQISLERDMIPSVIGKGGSNIQEIEKKFGLRIDVNRGTGIVSFRGPEDKIEMGLSHFRDLKLKFEKERDIRMVESKRQQQEETRKQHQDAKDSLEISAKEEEKVPIIPDMPPGFSNIPVGLSASEGQNMYLSKNAKRRMRRNRRRKEEAPTPMELLLGSPSSGSSSSSDFKKKKNNSSSNKSVGSAGRNRNQIEEDTTLTDAMRLLGLGNSMGILSPSTTLKAEEDTTPSSSVVGKSDGSIDETTSGFYSSSSGYKLRL